MFRLGARIVAILLGGASALLAQDSSTADVKAYIRSNDSAIFREFVGLLSIPNIHGDIPSLKKNAE